MEDLQRKSGWFLALGIAMIVLGVIAIGSPFVVTLAVNLLLGWVLIFGGLVQIVHAFSVRAWGGFLWMMLIGIVHGAVGGLLLRNPIAGVLTLTLLLAAFLLIEGICQLIMAFQLRPMPGSGWMMVSGIVGILLAVMIYSRWPSSAAWVLGTLVGINLIFDGWSMVTVWMAAKGTPPAPQEAAA